MQKKFKKLCIAETRKPSKSKFNKLMTQFQTELLNIEGFVQMQKIFRNFASISLENCVCVNRNIENSTNINS